MIEAVLNFIEKRIFRRLNAEISVDLELEEATLQAKTSNISCGGLFLRVDPSKIGKTQELNLAIHLPSRKHPIKLTGEILRSENGIRQGIAVQFQGLYNDNILEIDRYVKANLN